MSRDLTDWLLKNYGTEVMRPGLERMQEALSDLLPELKKKRVVTIAGTNGKGETTLRLSGELKKTPHLVWTSPHIERLTERFRDEKGEISESVLATIIDRCHEDLQQRKISLSYYEFLFFVFCAWAVESRKDLLLLEVGLGGRLDAVNVLDAELVLLPSISRDHQEILGNRYDLILSEKLGVLRPQKTLITALELSYLKERATLTGSKIGAKVIHLDSRERNFSARNAFLARAAFLWLENRSLDELGRWTFDGSPLENRGEVIQSENTTIFFGSHNPDGVRKLIQFLFSGNYNFSRPPYDIVLLAFSKRNDQDLTSMLRMVKRAGLGRIIVTAFDHPKALSAEAAEKISRQEGLDFVVDTNSLVQGKNHQNILVAGSYYFLADFKQRLRRLSST